MSKLMTYDKPVEVAEGRLYITGLVLLDNGGTRELRHFGASPGKAVTKLYPRPPRRFPRRDICMIKPLT